MQDHGQAELARQADLLFVEPDLAPRIQAWHEEVEPDLAHGHQARIAQAFGQQFPQRGNVILAGPRRIQRMDAQRIAVAMAPGQLDDAAPLAARHGRDDQPPHAHGVRPGAHAVAVGREFGSVEMAVRIYPHIKFHSWLSLLFARFRYFSY